MKRILTLLACLLLWSQLAWGHASLLSATPAPGAILEQAPAAITLTFNEPVGITILKLFDPRGHEVRTGPAANQDGHIRLPIQGGDAHGTYLLSWRIVSADGHPVGGTLDYSVGAPSAQAPTLAATPETARDVAIWATRWLTFLCVFAAVGAALFHSFRPEARQRWAWLPIAAGLLLLPADLGLQGLDLRDLPWTGLGDAATWSAALASTYAPTLGLYALALLLAAGGLRAQSGLLRGLGVASLVAVGIASAVSGHAGTAPPEWLSRPAVTLHVMMAIAWVGTLIPLARALRAGGQADAATRARQALAGFSRGIVPIVGLLALTGLSLAWLQMDGLDDLWQTRYGQVLVAKLSLVALLLCLAAYNRWRLTRPALSGSATAARQLHGTIRVEVLLAVLILAVVSLWRLTPPPRSLDAGRAMIHAVTLADTRVHAQVNPGSTAWHIRLSTPEGNVFKAQGVTLLLSNPQAGIEPMRRKAQAGPDGLWQVSVPALPMAGAWQIQVEILIDDFDQIVLKSGPPAADSGQMGDMGGMQMGGMHMDGTPHGH